MSSHTPPCRVTRRVCPGQPQASGDPEQSLHLHREPQCHAAAAVVDSKDSRPVQVVLQAGLDPRSSARVHHLAVVVDDRDQGITRVVRGRDLAPSTAIHDTLQVRLGAKRPSYRHHLLLLEDQGGKLAKLHGAVGWRELADRLAPSALCGRVAHLAGLLDAERAVTPGELVASFDWRHVSTDDVVFPL